METLRTDTGMPRRNLEAAIDRLAKEGWIRRDGEIVALALDPHEITLGDLYSVSMGEAPEPITKA